MFINCSYLNSNYGLIINLDIGMCKLLLIIYCGRYNLKYTTRYTCTYLETIVVNLIINGCAISNTTIENSLLIIM